MPRFTCHLSRAERRDVADVVTAVGDLDIDGLRTLDDTSSRAIALHLADGDPLVLDATGVRFLDCAGLGGLLAVRSHALRSGRGLQLLGAQPHVWHLLARTGLTEAFAAG